MKKILVLSILVVLILLGLAFCNTERDYKFIHPESEIVEIAFGKIEKADDGESDGIEHVFIPDRTFSGNKITEILNAFKQMKCFYIATDPHSMYAGTLGMKILYSNGDFEITNDFAQATYKSGRYKSTGYYCFEAEEFLAFLENYLGTSG